MAQKPPKKEPLRCLLLGGGDLGKSFLLERYINRQLRSGIFLPRTSGVEVRSHALKLVKSKRKLDVKFIDTSGQSTVLVLLPNHLSNCDAVIYLYDCTSRSSYDAVLKYQKLVKEHAQPDINAILISTKNDVTDDRRRVSATEGASLAMALGVEFFETSAVSGLNVDSAFKSLLKATAIRLAVNQVELQLFEDLMKMTVEAPHRTQAAAAADQFFGELFSPLHYACLFGGMGVLKQLLASKKGTELNALDSFGRTPLHIAALKKHTLCVRALITADADPRIRDKNGKTPGDLAKQLGNDEIKEMLDKAVDGALYKEAMNISRSSLKSCKLLILGTTGAGKTTLWRAIRGTTRAPDANPFARSTVQRTCVFESSLAMLSQLQHIDEDPGAATPSARQRLPSIGVSTTLAQDAARSASGDNSCWGICLLSGLCAWKTDDRLPGTAVSGDVYLEEDTGDVSIVTWDLSGHDVSGPLQKMMVETANVVVLCFDLFKAVYGREETLRDLTAIFGVMDTCLRPGVMNDGRMHHGVILVGTFRDALPAGEEEKAMDEISLDISRRLRTFNTFSRIRVPPAGRIFFSVGLGNRSLNLSPSTSMSSGKRQAAEVAVIRETICSAVARSGALRRNRPTMWLRVLEEMRNIPTAHIQSSGQSPFRSAITLERARLVADKVSREITAKPMDDQMFEVMLRCSADMGEIMILQGHLLVRPEVMLKIYQRLMEKCVSNKAGASPTSRRRAGKGANALPAHLEPVVQHLRSTGVIEHEHLLELFATTDDPVGVIVSVQAMEKAALCRRDGDLIFVPDIPLALHEELYPFPVDSPSIYDELSGKVLCYFHFQDSVPRGLLSLLVLHGSCSRTVEVEGLRFSYRPWTRPVLARDHAEIPLNGYTLSMTVDHRRTRISCAVSCQDGAYLTQNLEAQVGLLLYQMIEEVRKQHYARFKLDLQVADDGRIFDFVKDVLLIHKSAERKLNAAATGVGLLADDLMYDDDQPPVHSHFDFSDGGMGGHPELESVAHWATVFTHMPTSSYLPMPSALIQGTIASASARSAAMQTNPWTLRLEGSLRLVEGGADKDRKTFCLIPHPAVNRRRSQTSAYVALRAHKESSPSDAMVDAGSLWRLEQCREGFRVRVGDTMSGMKNWYLGLSSRAHKDKDQDVHVILTAEPSRATIWIPVPAEGAGAGFELRVQWSKDEVRYLSAGSRDLKNPDFRFVVVTKTQKAGRWNLEVPSIVESMNPYNMLSPLGGPGGSPGRFSLVTPRGMDLASLHIIVRELLNEITSAVEERAETSQPPRPSQHVAARSFDDLGADLAVANTTPSVRQRAFLAAKSMSVDDSGEEEDGLPSAAGLVGQALGS